MKMYGSFLLLFAISVPLLSMPAAAQSSATSNTSIPDNPSPSATGTTEQTIAPDYVRPDQKTKLRSYAFEVIGPYPILGAAFAAGINQAENTPPEWKQGAEAYGRRFGSDFGIAAVTTTTRYVFAEAFGEDTVYYRCECTGILPRFEHAVISTVTARRGEDGHRVFSIPSVISPYAGTMTAVYTWFPDRYNAKDGFRMGNYALLGFAGGNVALEFIYGGPHTLLSRMRRKKPPSP